MTPRVNTASWAEEVNEAFTPPEPKKTFTLTVIIPTQNCSERLLYCLESIKRQKFDNLEIIIVDASSIDRTIEVARSYAPFVSRVYSVSDFDLFDMINRGLSLASGKYVTIFLPGSSYLTSFCYKHIAAVAEEQEDPALIYFGSIQKEIGRGARVNISPFDRKFLESGKQVASLSACFFQREIFEKIGKFHTPYAMRGLYDFFCRLSKERQEKIIFLDRIFVEVDDMSFNSMRVARYVSETWSILRHHFGFSKAALWLLRLKLLHLIRVWVSSLMRSY